MIVFLIMQLLQTNAEPIVVDRLIKQPVTSDSLPVTPNITAKQLPTIQLTKVAPLETDKIEKDKTIVENSIQIGANVQDVSVIKQPIVAAIIATDVIVKKAIVKKIIAKKENVTETSNVVEKNIEKANIQVNVQPNILNDATIRAQLTSAISQREPTDNLQHAGYFQSLSKVLLFSHIKNRSGETIYHRWYYKNKMIANVALSIGSDSWRTNSSKRIGQNMQGAWHVEIVSEQNDVLWRLNFDVVRQ